jgi:hypothetical protein
MTTELSDDDEDEDEKNELKKKWINVIGFNSAKFDFVFLLPFLQSKHWEIVNSGFIGNPTKGKQAIVKHKLTKTQLRFLDLLLFFFFFFFFFFLFFLFFFFFFFFMFLILIILIIILVLFKKKL